MSCDLFSVDIMFFRISSSDMVWKETETEGSASVDNNPDLSLALLSAKYLPKVLVKLLIVSEVSKCQKPRSGAQFQFLILRPCFTGHKVHQSSRERPL